MGSCLGTIEITAFLTAPAPSLPPPAPLPAPRFFFTHPLLSLSPQTSWHGTRDPGGLCLSRSGTDQGVPSTCWTHTPSVSSSSVWSSTSSGEQTTLGTGSLASWPQSWWSLSGSLLVTRVLSSKE